MRHRNTLLYRVALVGILLAWSALAGGKPAGIRGELLVAGAEVPDAALKRFVERAGGKKAKILLLLGGKDNKLSQHLRKITRQSEEASVEVRSVTAADDGSVPDFMDFAGVWVAGDDLPRLRKALVGTALEQGCRDILARGGVVAASGPAATLLARTPAEGKARGCDLLPGTIVEVPNPAATASRLPAALKAHSDCVGIRIERNVALVVRGGKAEVVGRGKVHIYDRRKKVLPGQADHESLGDGARYDLKARKLLADEKNDSDSR